MKKRLDGDKLIAGASDAVRRLNPHLYGGAPRIEKPALGFLKPSPSESGKRIRQDPKPLMNKLETAWSEVLKRTNPKARPQAIRWRLGNGIFYKPDFVDLTCCPPTAWECKGPKAFRGGFENLKVAAGLYPEVRWVLVWRDAGQWKTQEVLP